MSTDFANTYEDKVRADAYASLEAPGTYYLAFRDLPAIIGAHVGGGRALDFGCGAGRSSRFLQRLGFETIGVDISPRMVEQARARDPGGDYRLMEDGDFSGLAGTEFGLVLSAFAFDNIATMEHKVSILRSLACLLGPGGRMVNLVSSPEIYVNEWTSFSTRDFPQNRQAASGDVVRVIMLDVDDRRPVEDIFWTDAAYRETYRRAGLDVLETHRPLGKSSDPHAWVSETEVAPWVVYVLGRDD